MASLISVIVLVHPRYAGALDACLSTVLAQETPTPFECIVVMNGFDSEASRATQQKYPTVTILPLEPCSRSHARNQGVARASGDFLAFIDAHTLVKKDFLAAMEKTLVERRSDAVQPALEFVDASGHLGRRLQNIWNIQTSASGHSFHNTFGQAFPSLDTSALFMRKHAFLEVGGFDTRFDRFEDRNLGQRLLRQGYYIHGAMDVFVTKTLKFKTSWQLLKDAWLDIYFAMKSTGLYQAAPRLRPRDVFNQTAFVRRRLTALRHAEKNVSHRPDVLIEFLLSAATQFVLVLSFCWFRLFSPESAQAPAQRTPPALDLSAHVYWSCGDKFTVKFFDGKVMTVELPLLLGDVFLGMAHARPVPNLTAQQRDVLQRKILTKLRTLGVLKSEPTSLA